MVVAGCSILALIGAEAVWSDGLSAYHCRVTDLPTDTPHGATLKSGTESIPTKRMTMAYRLLLLLLLLLLLSSSLLNHVNGFPDMLTNGRVGCMMDLSTDEVIMNNPVKSAEESDFSGDLVRVGWKLREDDKEIKKDESITMKKAPASYWFYMVVDPSTQLRDVQFVMEFSVPTSMTGKVRFEYGGCEDKRRVGGTVRNDAGNRLFIDEMPTDPIQVWAGWATGHGPVTLTPTLFIRPTLTSPISDEEEQERQRIMLQERKKKETEQVTPPPPPPPKNKNFVTKETLDAFEMPKGNDALRAQILAQQAKETKLVQEVQDMERAEEKEREAMAEELGDDAAAEEWMGHGLSRMERDVLKGPLAMEDSMRRNWRHRVHDKPNLMMANETRDVLDLNEYAKVKERIFARNLSMVDQQRILEKYKGNNRQKKRRQSRIDRSKDDVSKEERLDRFLQQKEAMMKLQDRRVLKPNTDLRLDDRHRDIMSDRLRKKLEELNQQAKLTGEEPKKEGEQQQDDDDDDEGKDATYWRRLKKRYNADDQELDMVQFTYGVIFFVVAQFLVIQLCLWGGGSEKGRREL